MADTSVPGIPGAIGTVYLNLPGAGEIPLPILPLPFNVTIAPLYMGPGFESEVLSVSPIDNIVPVLYETVQINQDDGYIAAVLGSGGNNLAVGVNFSNFQQYGVLETPTPLPGELVSPHSVVIDPNLGYVAVTGQALGDYLNVWVNTGLGEYSTPGIVIDIAGQQISTNNLGLPGASSFAAGNDTIAMGSGLDTIVQAGAAAVSTLTSTLSSVLNVDSIAALPGVQQLASALGAGAGSFGADSVESAQLASSFASADQHAGVVQTITDTVTSALQNTVATLDGGLTTLELKGVSSLLHIGKDH